MDWKFQNIDQLIKIAALVNRSLNGEVNKLLLGIDENIIIPAINKILVNEEEKIIIEDIGNLETNLTNSLRVIAIFSIEDEIIINSKTLKEAIDIVASMPIISTLEFSLKSVLKKLIQLRIHNYNNRNVTNGLNKIKESIQNQIKIALSTINWNNFMNDIKINYNTYLNELPKY